MNGRSHILAAATRSLLVMTFTLIFAGAMSAQVTLDGTASQGAFNALPNATALTWSHTFNSCTNCALYIGVSTYTSVLDVMPVLSVTYTNNGTNITPTLVGRQLSPPSTGTIPPTGNSSVQLYRVDFPPLGTAAGTAMITATSSLAANYIFGSSFSFTGVNQTTPNGSWNSTNGNSNSPSLTVSGDIRGGMILDILGSTPSALYLVPDSTQTICSDTSVETTCTRGRRFFGGTFDVGAMSYRTVLTSGTADQWSMTHADVWALGAIAINPNGTTASEASVQGQLLTPAGRGVNGAIVYSQNNKGQLSTAISSPFGYFTFQGLDSGETYIFSAYSKKFHFQPMAVTLNESVSGVQIIAMEPNQARAPIDEPESPKQRPALRRQVASPRLEP